MLSILAALIAAPTQAAPPPALTEEHRAVIKEAVGRRLADPYSAKYEWPAAKSASVYCGWVNAKNAYGAYVGYRQFMILYAIGNKSGKLLTFSKAEMDDHVVRVMCLENGYSLSR